MKKILYISAIILLCLKTNAQQNNNNISVSLESNNQIYEEDSKTGASKPDDKFGSNSYIDFIYNKNNISAGLRLESYNPALQSYSNLYNDTDIANKYVRFTNDFIMICAGNFYEQYGSGAIFRAYEERQLGIDNSLLGVNVHIKPTEYILLKLFSGKQRKGFETADSRLRGGDLEFNLSKFINYDKIQIKFGASNINKYETYSGVIEDYQSSIDAYSGRLSADHDKFSFSAEYSEKETDNILDAKLITSKALIINSGLYIGNFNANINFRCLKDMDFKSERNSADNMQNINYLPVLTKQQSYSLNNIYVYSTQVNSEIGFQVDAYYKIPKKTSLGGKYGLNINLNYSKYNNLKTDADNDSGLFLEKGDELLFEDLNIEIKKKFSKSFRTIFAYQKSKYNKGYIEEGGMDLVIKPTVAVADILYKFTRKNSIRAELQHMWNNKESKEWIAGTIELNFAPRLSFYALDNYNYGNEEEKIHYYKFGTSYTKGANRLELSYGRTRGGISCVGGVCRYMPAMRGLSFSILSKF